MAVDIVAVGADSPDRAIAMADQQEMPPKYTPQDHEKASGLTPVRLVGLADGIHGKTASFEFSGGFVRSLDVDSMTIWHSIFAGLSRADWQELRQHVAPRTRRPDGAIATQEGPMWFWTALTTPRGRHLGWCYFDVPEEDYQPGRVTGTRAARDLICFMRDYKRARLTGTPNGDDLGWYLQRCLEEAFALAHSGKHCNGPTRANAALAFCQLVTAYFSEGTANANPAYLEARLKQELEAQVRWAEYEDRVRAEAAERMRAVRAAKSAKRGEASVQSAPSRQRVAKTPTTHRTGKSLTADGHTLQ